MIASQTVIGAVVVYYRSLMSELVTTGEAARILRISRSTPGPAPRYGDSPHVTGEGTAVDDATRTQVTAVLETSPARHALAQRDIGEVYRQLAEARVAQATIAEATGQSPSEVSEIINGRRVQGYDVLVRIADGLAVPRGWMGLAHTLPVPSDTSGEEVSEDVKRRAFLAVVSTALFGRPVLGEVLELPNRPDSPTPLPSQLGMADVDALRALTERMRALARQFGGQGDTVSAIAVRSSRLMAVDASAAVRRSLAAALAELHTVAGWCSFDSHAPADVSRAHFTRGLELATEAGDTYLGADAMYHAAMTMQNDSPDDSLKLLQLAQIRLGKDSGHSRGQTLDAWLHVDTAHALIMMDHPVLAKSSLAAARDEWDPADRFDQADMDHVVAQAHRGLGDLDAAEQFAASSVRTWSDKDRRDGVQAGITLAGIHLAAGEPAGMSMAEKAIHDVASLQSHRARAKLDGLAADLAARPDREARALAGHARRVATSRA